MTWTPRRKVSMLLAAATLIPIGLLCWLGARVVAQDRDVAQKHRQESLTLDARGLALAMERRFGDLEEQLARGFGIRLTPTGLEPGQRSVLLFRSVLGTTADAPDSVFSEAEASELQRNDLSRASTVYRSLAESSDPAVRAGALLRLGRVLRKRGDRAGALQAYSKLSQLRSTAIDGQPAELLALQGRCKVFEESRDRDALREEAAALARELYSGSQPVDRLTFGLYQDMLRQWGAPPPSSELVARTEAAVSLWRAWRAGDLSPSGRRILHEEQMRVLAVWAGGPDRPAAWLATPAEFESSFGPLWTGKNLAVSLFDPEGHAFLGPRREGAVALTPGETRFPFVLSVASSATAAGADGDRLRRGVLIGGLLLAFLLMLAAAYGLYRATSRELAVARLQSEFVSAVSHEFRTPLTSMRHLTEMLTTRGAPSEDRKAQYYELLARETGRLHRMVESLLSFGRMEAGAYAWRLEPEDPCQLAHDTAEEFRQETLAKDRQVVCETDEGVPPVRADREALSRALWNLLENAAKYSEPGSPIRVFVRRNGRSVLLGVEDKGVGVPPGEQKKIFQKFARGAEARRAGIRGVGIGLALVKRIAETHGGSVELSSQPGRGSTFTLVLPCPES